MIAHKNITKIVAVVMAVVTCLCLAAIACAELFAEVLGGPGVTMEYESRLFDTDEILSINIIMDDGEWNDMLSNAVSEIYSQCDVEINGEMFYRVGIRPKGNTSLTSIASDPETDRYSFKLEFDQYVEGQSCYGLDKLILNNNYADATNMKEALIYDMYQYLNVDASLYNYAKISVNGEYWGVYLALEAVEDSFLLRNYGTENGELYKPDSMDMGGGGSGFGNMMPPDAKPDSGDAPDQFSGRQPPSRENMDNSNTVGQMQESAPKGSEENQMPDMENSGFPRGGGFGGFSMGGNGANLNYTDDELDSYSAIWDGEVTDSGKTDHRRVITALKNISEGTSLERYMDVDNLLKYMAVHVFSVNEDSLSGMMAHNYYLYEADGKLNILPWDYNLAFGGMGGMGGMNGADSATSMVNDAIDNAFSGTNFFNTLMENKEYQSIYYSYLRQLTDEYIFGGGFEAFYNRVRSQIDSLIESDPTAFYTYEEYLEAVDTLYEVVQLRGESIKGQVEGTIPSTGDEQRNSDALVDASYLNLSVMGSMSMGDRMREWNESDDNSEEDAVSSQSGEREFPGDFDPSQFSEGMPPEGFDISQSDSPSFEKEVDNETVQEDSQEENDTKMGSDVIQEQRPWGMERGSENMSGMNFVGGNGNSNIVDGLILNGLCLVLLIIAFIFVKAYHRRSYK